MRRNSFSDLGPVNQVSQPLVGLRFLITANKFAEVFTGVDIASARDAAKKPAVAALVL